MASAPQNTVLVVEDDDDVREVLIEALQHLGYPTQQACDGKSALALMAAGTIGVVVLDLMMPGMNGWEFRAQQRQQPAIAHVPIVVLTALSGEWSRRDLVGVPDCDFLTKPIDLLKLSQVLARHVATSSPH